MIFAKENPVQKFLSLWLCFAAAVLTRDVNGAPNRTDPDVLSLAGLQTTIANAGCVVQSFHLEGVVCAVVPDRKIIALQDDSATVLLELPALDKPVRAGDRLAIEANQCTLTRTRFGIRMGTEVVNNDGEHSVILESNQVFLAAGRQPLRLEWFNASTSPELSLQYEGPGIPRQPIPAAALCWHAPGQTEFQRGLHYAAYVQQPVQPVQPVGGWWLANAWHALPDFARLQPAAEGVATNFNVRYRTRDEYSALVFSGCLEVPKSGLYTFFLKSNDGSRLYVGDPSSRCKITVLAGASVPAVQPWNQVSGASGFQWSELNGTVIFVSPEEDGTELELATAKGPVQVMVVEAPSNTVPTLIHRRIEARGICETSPHGGALMITPGWAQINVSSPMTATPGSSTNVTLNSVEQVRRLTPEQARAGLRARITGVVIAATSDSLVLQDGSGGVFVHWHSDNLANWPHVGELWEIEGKTDPGDFSPAIFADSAKYLARVPMPQPIRPTWDQLMNGSLDAEYVELRGVVTALSSTEMKLLTPDGTVTVEGNLSRPLPQPPSSVSSGRSL